MYQKNWTAVFQLLMNAYLLFFPLASQGNERRMLVLTFNIFLALEKLFFVVVVFLIINSKLLRDKVGFSEILRI